MKTVVDWSAKAVLRDVTSEGAIDYSERSVDIRDCARSRGVVIDVAAIARPYPEVGSGPTAAIDLGAIEDPRVVVDPGKYAEVPAAVAGVASVQYNEVLQAVRSGLPWERPGGCECGVSPDHVARIEHQVIDVPRIAYPDVTPIHPATESPMRRFPWESGDLSAQDPLFAEGVASMDDPIGTPEDDDREYDKPEWPKGIQGIDERFPSERQWWRDFPPLEPVRPPSVVAGRRLVSPVWVEVRPQEPGYWDFLPYCRVGAAFIRPAEELVVVFVDGVRPGWTRPNRRVMLQRVDFSRSRPDSFGVPVGEPEVLFAAPSFFPHRESWSLHGVQGASNGTGDAVFVGITTRPDSTVERGSIVLWTIPGAGGSARVSQLGAWLPEGARLAPVVPGIACSNTGETLLAYVRTAVGRETALELVEVGFLRDGAFSRTATIPVPGRDQLYENVAVAYDATRREWAVFFVTGNYLAYVQLLGVTGRRLTKRPQLVTDGQGDGAPHSGNAISFNPRTGRYIVATAHNQFVLQRTGKASLQCILTDNSGASDCQASVSSPQADFNPFLNPGTTGPPPVLNGRALATDQKWAVAPIAKWPWEFAFASSYGEVTGTSALGALVRAEPPLWRTDGVVMGGGEDPAYSLQMHVIARLPTLPGLACVWVRYPRIRLAGSPESAPLGEIHSTLLTDAEDPRFQ